jgi:hypothetical protein
MTHFAPDRREGVGHNWLRINFLEGGRYGWYPPTALKQGMLLAAAILLKFNSTRDIPDLRRKYFTRTMRSATAAIRRKNCRSESRILISLTAIFPEGPPGRGARLDNVRHEPRGAPRRLHALVRRPPRPLCSLAESA